MKYIALTFDDGRSDNYLVAKKIMDTYNFRGTLYVTTGFIDGTWKEFSVLESPTRPLTVEEIKKLYNSKWEISLHGDKHRTEILDMKESLKKLSSWGIKNTKWGMSIPNSAAQETVITDILNSDYGKSICYVRRGRMCNTRNILYILLYIIYNVFKLKWAYNLFNKNNIFKYEIPNKKYIPSIVIKSNDIPELVVNFINKMPDNTVCVLMLHSVLEKNHPKCDKDKWSWNENKFNDLCMKLKELSDKGQIEVKPLIEIIE